MTNVRHIGYLTFHVAPLDAEDTPVSCTDPYCDEPASWREMVFAGEGTATGEPSADWGQYLYSNAHCDAHRFAVADIVQGALDRDRSCAMAQVALTPAAASTPEPRFAVNRSIRRYTTGEEIAIYLYCVKCGNVLRGRGVPTKTPDAVELADVQETELRTMAADYNSRNVKHSGCFL